MLASRGDFHGIERNLKAFVRRNQDVRSAARRLEASCTGTTLMSSSSAIVPSTSRYPGVNSWLAMRVLIHWYACCDLLGETPGS